MATKLYLRNLVADNPPTAGEKSTALPVGTFKGSTGTAETRALKSTKGSAQTNIGLTALGQTEHQDNYIARFTSDVLGAQTIAANTWTLAVATSEIQTGSNSFTVLSLYVWRPSTTSVVGYIYDSDTTLGVEWGTGEDGQVLTFSGSAVTAQANDVLVLEVWRHAAQDGLTTWNQQVYFEGTTDVTDSTVADAASYISTPQTLNFITTVTGSKTADAILKKTQTDSKTADAILKKTQTGSETADAVLKKAILASFSADARLAYHITGQILADAVLKKTQLPTLLADAIIRKLGITSIFTADAFLNRGGIFLVDAILKKLGLTGSVTANTVLRKVLTGSFTANAVLKSNRTTKSKVFGGR